MAGDPAIPQTNLCMMPSDIPSPGLIDDERVSISKEDTKEGVYTGATNPMH